MSDPITYETVRLGELRDPSLDSRWDDVENVARMTPEKKQALLSNPCAQGDDDPVQLLALRGRQPIGRIDLVLGRLLVRGQPTPIAWGSMLTVPEQHRHTLAGAFLVMRASTLFPNTGAHGPSRMALPLYEKLKFSSLPLDRLILLRRSRAVVEKKLGKGFPARAAGLLADAALAAQRALLSAIRTTHASSLSAERIDRMPADLDARLHDNSVPVQPLRSAAWINWVLTHSLDSTPPGHPPFRRDLFLLRRGSETVGYFLTKLRFYPVASASGFENLLLGSLQDWQVFSPVASESTIALLAVRELSRLGADAIEFCTASDATTRSLRRLGFVRVGKFTSVIKPTPKSPLNDPALLTPAAWRLRPADGDNALI